MQTQIPIIINQPPPRDCIVVSGKKYCEELTTTPREAGLMLLAILLFIAWGGITMLIADRYDWEFWQGLVLFLLPVLLFAIYLIL